jgi:hypothetical protein
LRPSGLRHSHAGESWWLLSNINLFLA